MPYCQILHVYYVLLQVWHFTQRSWPRQRETMILATESFWLQNWPCTSGIFDPRDQHLSSLLITKTSVIWKLTKAWAHASPLFFSPLQLHTMWHTRLKEHKEGFPESVSPHRTHHAPSWLYPCSCLVSQGSDMGDWWAYHKYSFTSYLWKLPSWSRKLTTEVLDSSNFLSNPKEYHMSFLSQCCQITV